MTKSQRKKKFASQQTTAGVSTPKKSFVTQQESEDITLVNDESKHAAKSSPERDMIIVGVLVFCVCWFSAGTAIFNYLTGAGVNMILAVLGAIVGGFIATVAVLAIGVIFLKNGF